MKATLSDKQREGCKKAASALITSVFWGDDPAGGKWWENAHARLDGMSRHGTWDGKPADSSITSPYETIILNGKTYRLIEEPSDG